MLIKDDGQTIVPGLLNKCESTRECTADSRPNERSEAGRDTFQTSNQALGTVANSGHRGDNLIPESLDCRRSAKPDAAIDGLRSALLLTSTRREEVRKRGESQSWGRKLCAYISSLFRISRRAG